MDGHWHVLVQHKITGSCRPEVVLSADRDVTELNKLRDIFLYDEKPDREHTRYHDLIFVRLASPAEVQRLVQR